MKEKYQLKFDKKTIDILLEDTKVKVKRPKKTQTYNLRNNDVAYSVYTGLKKYYDREFDKFFYGKNFYGINKTFIY